MPYMTWKNRAAIHTCSEFTPPQPDLQLHGGFGSNPLESTTRTFSERSVKYIVTTPSMDMKRTRTCGGCTVLHALADRLEAIGKHVCRLPYLDVLAIKERIPSCARFQAVCDSIRHAMPGINSSTVVILPEGLRCSCRKVRQIAELCMCDGYWRPWDQAAFSLSAWWDG